MNEDAGTRTQDQLIKSQLLYQLSYILEPAELDPLTGTRGNRRLIPGDLTRQTNLGAEELFAPKVMDTVCGILWRKNGRKIRNAKGNGER